jgi:hypothetical protein
MALAGMILAILGGVVVINLLLWVPIIRRLKRMPAEMRRALEAAGETIVLGPERAMYEGASSEYGVVKGIGTVILTDRQLVFKRAIGKQLAIPRADITAVRSEKWFNGSRVGTREFVVLTTTKGIDVGFLFDDRPTWMNALSPSSASARS